jgi:lipopolysaccharide transport system ATP-binding protein
VSQIQDLESSKDGKPVDTFESKAVISVRNITKAYRIWERPSARLSAPLQERIADWLPPKSRVGIALRKRASKNYRDFFALNQVSFDVVRGESVGIIGVNGSGKSTLLQIIAGTLQPTDGRILLKGRVAALLELGSGFNPDFTGRENVYLNGAVQGLSHRTVDSIFDSIATFADIGSFIDQPVKTYSSGMMVRLAFAAQTAIAPEVLIVDEALSVGDEAFQRKCFARIEALKKDGTTLLFVSHSAGSIIELCDRAILLDRGKIQLIDRPKNVINVYHQQIYGRASNNSAITQYIQPGKIESTHQWLTTTENSRQESDDSFLGRAVLTHALFAYPEAGARISNPRIVNQEGKTVNNLRRGHSYHYLFDVTITETLRGVRFGALIKTPTGMEIAGMASHPQLETIPSIQPGETFNVRFTFRCRLLVGSYFLNAGVLATDGEGQEYFAHRLVDACSFHVLYENSVPVNALIDLLERAEIARGPS